MTTSRLLWRRLDLPGHEIGVLAEREGGFELEGTALFLHEGEPCRLDYRVLGEPDWRTREVEVRGYAGGRDVLVTVAADGRGQWRMNGAPCPAVEGCVDVDLSFSPSTNLLPIRRLALEVGGRAAVEAAWMRFPELRLERLLQVYAREEATRYHYESAGGSFVRTLEVDAAGFVLDYPGLWCAEAVGERGEGPASAGGS